MDSRRDPTPPWKFVALGVILAAIAAPFGSPIVDATHSTWVGFLYLIGVSILIAAFLIRKVEREYRSP